jgi:hypothetical protein
MGLKSVFAGLMVVTAMTGCATASRTEAVSAKVFTTTSEAVAELTAITSLQRGKGIDIKIESTSPSIKGKRVPNKFEVVDIIGKKGEAYTLIVAPRCDCLGFRKYSIYPDASLLDQAGMPIGDVVSNSPKIRVLRGTFPQDGTYKLVIIADNTEQGKKLGDVDVYLGAVSAFKIAETVYPTGRVEVNFEAQ